MNVINVMKSKLSYTELYVYFFLWIFANIYSLLKLFEAQTGNFIEFNVYIHIFVIFYNKILSFSIQIYLKEMRNYCSHLMIYKEAGILLQD